MISFDSEEGYRVSMGTITTEAPHDFHYKICTVIGLIATFVVFYGVATVIFSNL